MVGSLKEAERWLARGEETLEAASIMAEHGFYNEAVSRAYYAMFYVAKAAIVKEGVRTKKHSGVISAFGRLFSKTNRLDPRFHKALLVAFEERDVADYSIGPRVAEQSAKARLTEAEAFVLAVKTLIET